MCHLTWADLPLDLEWQPLHGAHGSAAGFRAFLSPLAGGGAHFVSRVSRAHRGNSGVAAERLGFVAPSWGGSAVTSCWLSEH